MSAGAESGHASSAEILTVTFHWATNYGAALQAYCLQMWLRKHGWTSSVLNYQPLDLQVRSSLSALRRGDWPYLLQTYQLSRFRRSMQLWPRFPVLVRRRLASSCEGASPSAVVCGSDQIWNEFFISPRSTKPNLTYFLDFVPERIPRVAYAASFGSGRYSSAAEALVVPLLRGFRAIGVRVTSGADLVGTLGLQAQVVLDPVLLAGAEVLAPKVGGVQGRGLVAFFLHGQAAVNEHLVTAVGGVPGQDYDWVWRSQDSRSMEGWLGRINAGRLVLTNSYHVVCVSILFHVPFIAVAANSESAGMNDRFATMLGQLGLSNRYLPAGSRLDPALVATEIKWAEVDRRLADLRAASAQFLLKNLPPPRAATG